MEILTTIYKLNDGEKLLCDWHAGRTGGFYTCLFLFRTFAISKVGFDIGAGVNFYATEASFTIWSLYLYRRLK